MLPVKVSIRLTVSADSDSTALTQVERAFGRGLSAVGTYAISAGAVRKSVRSSVRVVAPRKPRAIKSHDREVAPVVKARLVANLAKMRASRAVRAPATRSATSATSARKVAPLKTRKTRAPMTPERRLQAIESLAKARAARAANKSFTVLQTPVQ